MVAYLGILALQSVSNLSPEGRSDRKRKWADGSMDGFHSQDVTDDPDAPHIRGQTHRLVIDHLRGHKLWGPVHHLKRRGVICKHIMCIKCKAIVER